MTALRIVLILLVGGALGVACDDVCRPEPEPCMFAVDCPSDRVCLAGVCRGVCELAGDECACEPAPDILPADMGVCPGPA